MNKDTRDKGQETGDKIGGARYKEQETRNKEQQTLNNKGCTLYLFLRLSDQHDRSLSENNISKKINT
jgi:hypothetical protein